MYNIDLHVLVKNIICLEFIPTQSDLATCMHCWHILMTQMHLMIEDDMLKLPLKFLIKKAYYIRNWCAPTHSRGYIYRREEGYENAQDLADEGDQYKNSSTKMIDVFHLFLPRHFCVIYHHPVTASMTMINVLCMLYWADVVTAQMLTHKSVYITLMCIKIQIHVLHQAVHCHQIAV